MLLASRDAQDGKFAFSQRTLISLPIAGSITVHWRSLTGLMARVNELENANLRGGESAPPRPPAEQRG
jgi:hypothetical protein